MLCTPTWVLNVAAGEHYAHRPVPAELSLTYDAVEKRAARGERAARPAPRQGRARAHPQRLATVVPRSGHQLHRRERALRSGRGVQAHALSALHRRQRRAGHREPAAIRSRHPARGVRPHRPHTRANDSSPRSTFDSPLCPFIAAAVEINDPDHPARMYARDYKQALAARLTETAREAGATNPEQLGEQLALLLDGAAARSRVLNTSTFSTAAAIAAVLIDNGHPHGSGTARRALNSVVFERSVVNPEPARQRGSTASRRGASRGLTSRRIRQLSRWGVSQRLPTTRNRDEDRHPL